MPAVRSDITIPDGTLARYNNYKFGASVYTEGIHLTPIQSQDGRTTIFTKYRITLVEHVNATSSTEVKSAVALLSQQGGRFEYKGRPTGSMSINIGTRGTGSVGGAFDVCWGPVVEDIQLVPFCARGDGTGAAKIVWTVVVGIPNCDDAKFGGQIMDWCWGVTYDRGQDGYTKVTTHGTITIPMTRRTIGDRTLPDSADAYLEKIYPALRPGYRRTPGTWELSPDKRSGTYSVTDEEMPPNAPPPDVIRCEANHVVGTDGGQWYKWTGTLSATFEIARGATVAQAVQAFFNLLADRIAEQRRAKPFLAPHPGGGAAAAGGGAIAGGLLIGLTAGLPGGLGGLVRGFLGGGGRAAPVAAGPGEPTKVTVVPWQFTMEDASIYDRQRVRLVCSYKVAAVELKEMLSHSGLWRAVPGSDWVRWAASLTRHLSARGLSSLTFDLNSDKIVDLCGPVAPPKRPSMGSQYGYDNHGIVGSVPSGASGGDLYAPPEPGGSWLHYACAISVVREDGVTVVKTLPNAPLVPDLGQGSSAGGRFDALNDALPGSADTPPQLSTQTAVPSGDTVTQQRVRPTTYIYLTGEAARVLYPIPCPEVVEINGQPAVACNRDGTGEGFTTAIAGNTLYPVYVARWRLRYVLIGDGDGGPLPVPPSLLG